MNISEKNIEDLIYDSLMCGEKDKLIQRGLHAVRPYDMFFRQTDLGSYGRSDLIGLSYRHVDNWDKPCKKKFRIGVIEIKKGLIDYNAFIQAVRYCKAIERILDDYNMVAMFKIILIGTEVCKSAFCFLPDVMEELSIYNVKLDLDKGIVFKSINSYHFTNERSASICPDNFSEIRRYVKSKIKEGVYSELPF